MARASKIGISCFAHFHWSSENMPVQAELNSKVDHCLRMLLPSTWVTLIIGTFGGRRILIVSHNTIMFVIAESNSI